MEKRTQSKEEEAAISLTMLLKENIDPPHPGDKNFNEEGAWKRHMLIHTGDPERHAGHSDAKHFPCSLCRKPCSQGSDLKKHMRINHSFQSFPSSFFFG